MTKRAIKNTRKNKQKSGKKRVIKDKFIEGPPPIQAKNQFQKEVLKAAHSDSAQVVVVIAPAGCGKSLLSMGTASDWYAKGQIDKIMITRPAVGMGKTLGLLKGDLKDKFTPYLAPLIEVYKDRYGSGKYENDVSQGAIEMAPLEYVRGRNIDGVCIIDEAQCTTPDELYTLITRVTENGKLFIIGDPRQSDIKGESGLEWIERFSEDNDLSDFIKVIKATSDDIVRGGLCKAVVKAQEREKNYDR